MRSVEGRLEEKVVEYKRKLLADALAKCTEPQRDKFARFYPEPIPPAKLTAAIGLCERTVIQNAKLNRS